MELISMHTHSTFCGHAKDSLADMMEAASQAGISTIAATEHYPLPPSYKEAAYASMPYDRLEEYFAAVKEEQNKYPHMEILLGCELDWLGQSNTESLELDDFERFDVVLGSVHFIDAWLFNSSRYKDVWARADIDELWEKYVDLWCEAATSNMPYTVMAHPDVIKKFGYYPKRFDMQRAWRRMAEAARIGGRMVEVNTSGRFHACGEYYPALGLLKEFRRAGVLCTVGTDAHRVDDIARDIQEAYAYMAAAGYCEVAVPLRGGGVRMMPIE